MLTSYHVHSTFSDGENSVGEMIRSAIDAGVDEVGVSDHLVLLAGDQTVDWSMSPAAIPRYFDAIAEASDDRITIKYGIEADFDPKTAEELRDLLQSHAFDYVIGSVHFLDGFPIDVDRKYWDELSETECNDVILGYWNRIAQMARSGLFDFAGHLDIYKKFGTMPTVDISEAIITALDAITQARMAVELNTSGWHKPIREAYPSIAILRGCHKRGIPTLVTADAHKTQDIVRDFDRARQLLRNIGYTRQATFKARNIINTDMI
ncbi:MAG: histidinol-phosphatase HisJ family protein [Armatimonadota bacterium]|nr:histidinol-phosphatase HisJ family protein [bacterium]